MGYSLDELQNDVTKETPPVSNLRLIMWLPKCPGLPLRNLSGLIPPDFSNEVRWEAMAIGRTSMNPSRKQCSTEIGLKDLRSKVKVRSWINCYPAGVKRPSAERPTYLYKALRTVLMRYNSLSSPDRSLVHHPTTADFRTRKGTEAGPVDSVDEELFVRQKVLFF